MKAYSFKSIAVIFFSAAFVLSLFMACQTAPTNKANEDFAAQYVQDEVDLWNNQNVSLLDKNYHTDSKRISPFGTLDGLDAFKTDIQETFQTWSDIDLSISEHWVKDDVITMLWTWKGTNTGPLGDGIPATGKTISIDGISKITLADGKVKEHRLFWDRLAGNLQMGFTLVPPKAPDTTGGDTTEPDDSNTTDE
jgi:predicted ester cyclase